MSNPNARELMERHLHAHQAFFASCHDPNDRKWFANRIKYYALCDDPAERFQMWLYRLDERGKPLGPFIANKLQPFAEIEDYLQEAFGPGHYQALIKQGPSQMVHKERFDIAERPMG